MAKKKPKRTPPNLGPPFVLWEDHDGNTFTPEGDSLIPHSKSIREYWLNHDIKKKVEKVEKDGMTMYELRPILPPEEPPMPSMG